ncbi:MAG TPA: nucleotidyltransferase domain-containing protein [Spirochaetota bacterium]|nr:nucleotidyltransferase domain-containing protein [Spirochaetota bacterium]HPP05637.1 nucleotidyltransferase domain-containing protein [Spirochaetota bacterium]
MRINEQEEKIIKEVLTKYFGENAVIYLFGSRINDSKKGGDIDIFVEADISLKDMVKAKIKSLVELEKLLGERKIDLVIKNTSMKEELIHRNAKKGIRL